jgi:hypothetical protein
MSDDTAPSQPDKPPEEKKTPLPAGQVYIGMSNTRGVIMQIHAQRFQQALTLNLVGLAGFVTWVSSAPHDRPVLIIAGIGCLVFMGLNAFWSALIYATALALHRWTEQINTLVDTLGIEGVLDPGLGIPIPRPPLSGWSLYMTIIACIVGWGILLALVVLTLN